MFAIGISHRAYSVDDRHLSVGGKCRKGEHEEGLSPKEATKKSMQQSPVHSRIALSLLSKKKKKAGILYQWPFWWFDWGHFIASSAGNYCISHGLIRCWWP